MGNNIKLTDFLKLARTKKIISNLSVGEPLENIPGPIKRTMIKAVQNNKNKYTLAQGLDELRDKLAKKVIAKNNISLDQEDIIITSGVTAGLTIALLSVLLPGDELIIIEPYFLAFPKATEILNLKVKFAPTDKSFSLASVDFTNLVTSKTKAILICNPSNPTGVVYSKEELSNLAEFAKSKNLWIISDEIYEDFIYEGQHTSIGSIYGKTISMFGFSKSYSMTGWRLGYNVVPDELINKMTEIQRYLFYAPSTPAQYGALEFNEIVISEKIKSFDEKRRYVLDNLSATYKISNKPSGAFYVFPELPEGFSGEVFSLKALESGVLVFPGSLFSQKDTNFRISYSTSMEELKKGIEILNTLF